MIETIQRKDTPLDNPKYDLIVEGTRVKEANAGDHYATITTGQAFSKLATSRFVEFGQSLEYLQLEWRFAASDSLDSIWIFASGNIMYVVRTNLQNWKRPYSFSEYTQMLLSICEAFQLPEFQFERYEKEDHAFELKFSVNPQLYIVPQVERTSRIVSQICKEAEQNLLTRVNGYSLTTVFDFPEAVKVPCEQYLMYFIQFLKDLGIEAGSDLKHEAGRVLFTVTPGDKTEGLEKIRAALNIYIKLPSSPLDESPSLENDLAVQRLIANIYHLKGQLALTHAIMQAQQITISQLDVLRNDVMRRSLIEAVPPASKEQEEDIFGGLVAITPYEGKGFRINLPKLFRWLKDGFAKRD